MKRRTFLQTASLAGLGTQLVGTSTPARAAETGAARDVYELRTYTLKSGKKAALDEYLSKALIPAAGRLGLGPVGVFTDSAPGDLPTLTTLLVFSSPDAAVNFPDRLAADEDYLKAGADYLNAPPSDPVYERIESSLHLAIDGLPHLQPTDASKSRILNLRIYESHNERAARKKVEMFNLHELPLFVRVGLKPVFFGATLVGSHMPNLTYMLVFPDDAERAAAWKRFGGDDEWKKLKAMPEYMDKEIVSKITNKILTPESYSQI